jgi:hypothetical protein
MLDATLHIILAWQHIMIARPGSSSLVKSVMAACPIHHLLIADAPCWLLDEMGKGSRGFYWGAMARANRGQCIVAWDQVCKPYVFGGLGIKDLWLQGLKLRIRWEWLSRTDPSRPWQGLPMATDAKAREVFDRLIRITRGDGKRVLFLRDKWIQGGSVTDIVPNIAGKVTTRHRNARTVEQGLAEHRWEEDNDGPLSPEELQHCITLWIEIHATPRDLRLMVNFSLGPQWQAATLPVWPITAWQQKVLSSR